MRWRRKRSSPQPTEYQRLIEQYRDRGVRVWGSSFTVTDTSTWLPVSGGGMYLDDGTVLAGDPPPEWALS